MKIDKMSSERLAILRFPLIVGVVFIHAYGNEVVIFSNNPEGIIYTSNLIDFIRNLVSEGIARVAVPLFFLLSGYFFFLGFNYSIENYSKKVKSRISTLLIPFLFWNIFTLLLLAFAQFLPATQAFFSGKSDPISSFGVFDYVNAILGLNRSPISYQFWFIRDLIVMTLLAPAIYLVLKKVPRLFFIVILILWFFKIWPIYVPSAAAFAFFYSGAYFAHNNISLFALDRFGMLFTAFYTGTLIIDTMTKSYILNSYIHNLGIILGIATILFATRFIVGLKIVRNALLWAGGCSFFVFAVHEPMLRIAQKITYKLLTPNNDIFVLSLYFLTPTLVIITSTILYVSLKSIAPKFLHLISGGR